jgi:hypothetical protein
MPSDTEDMEERFDYTGFSILAPLWRDIEDIGANRYTWGSYCGIHGRLMYFWNEVSTLDVMMII